MGRAARKLVEYETPVVRTRPHGASAVDAPHSSPARRLQDELSARLATPEKPDWSPRRTVAFIVVASSAGWSLIAAAAMLALR